MTAPWTIGLGLVVAAGLAAGGDEPDPVFEGGLKRSRALVIVLHGGSWVRREPRDLARRAVNDLTSEARRSGLRLLAPCAPWVAWQRMAADGNVPWIQPEGEARVLDLIESELARGRADPGRVYLAGHGAGATGALMLGARHPDRFAAVAAWSGTPAPLWDKDRNVIGLVEDTAGLRDVPVYLWTGSHDEVLDRDALRLFVQALRSQHGAADRGVLRWDQGRGGHDYGRNGPGRGLRFLKTHRRPVAVDGKRAVGKGRETGRRRPPRAGQGVLARHHLGAVGTHVHGVLELRHPGAGLLDQRAIGVDGPGP